MLLEREVAFCLYSRYTSMKRNSSMKLKIGIIGSASGPQVEDPTAMEEAGGMVIGISPAFSEYEHVNEYMSPHYHDILIYTGLWFMNRDIINIRSCDAVILISGGIGSLNEFTIAYDEGRPVGILTNSGGISNSIPHIVEELCHRHIPPNVVFDDTPATLLDKLEIAIKTFPLPIHQDGRVKDHRLGRG